MVTIPIKYPLLIVTEFPCNLGECCESTHIGPVVNPVVLLNRLLRKRIDVAFEQREGAGKRPCGNAVSV